MSQHNENSKTVIPGVKFVKAYVCKFNEKCNNDTCQYIHPDPVSYDDELNRKGDDRELCRHFYTNNCSYDRCFKLHIIDRRMITNNVKQKTPTVAASNLSDHASEVMKAYFQKISTLVAKQRSLNDGIQVLKSMDLLCDKDEALIITINETIKKSLSLIAPKEEIPTNPAILKQMIVDIINIDTEKQQKCIALQKISESTDLLKAIEYINAKYTKAIDLL